MILKRKDVEKIINVLDQFPDIDTFEIDQEGGSGIGTSTYMTFAYTVKGHRGSFNIEISGVEDW
jgi:hypothetical protein